MEERIYKNINDKLDLTNKRLADMKHASLSKLQSLTLERQKVIESTHSIFNANSNASQNPNMKKME